MTKPVDQDSDNNNNDDGTVQRVLPEQHHMLQQNMLSHVEFVTLFCLENQISVEGLTPNVMLQLASSAIQTRFTAGGVEYHFITNTEGEHICQRDGVFDVYVVEEMA